MKGQKLEKQYIKVPDSLGFVYLVTWILLPFSLFLAACQDPTTTYLTSLLFK